MSDDPSQSAAGDEARTGDFDLLRIFDEARAIAGAAARSAYLDRVCPPERRSEVDAILAADDASGGAARVDRLAADTASLVMSSMYSGGDRIGPYELVSLLGEGGFGEVWRARQEEPVRRDVALKLVKPGMDSLQVIRRFESERRTLASLDHPHVARILDAGLTDAGRPYFAMELVEGEPIVRYCDARRLPTPARLALFTRVCRAIQHAHQKGVIHRDIKPSNVLVAEHDGEAVPKVIDFGIARAFEADGTDRTRFTEGGQLLGTPGYMSPEQASMEPELVDTRSDVYSLGVLLYELLVGRPPFESESLRRAGIAEMLRIIREIDPPRPSTRIMTLGPDSGTVAEARGATPKRMRHELDGELDWIVMQCLAKERDRRYDSASALADDVERALRHEPVVAGPPSWSYRARTFVRRHRVGVGVTAAVAAAVVLGTVGTTVGFLRAEAGWASSRENERVATAANERARASLYVALMRLASDAVVLPDVAAARTLLEDAPAPHRGWEHRHFAARTAPSGTTLEETSGTPRVLADPARDRFHLFGGDLSAWPAAADGSDPDQPLRPLWRRPRNPDHEGLTRRAHFFRTADGARLVVARERWTNDPGWIEDPAERADEAHRQVHVSILDAATGDVIHALDPLAGRVPPSAPAIVGDRCPIVLRTGGDIRIVTIDVTSGDLLHDRRLGHSSAAGWWTTTAPGGHHVAIVVEDEGRLEDEDREDRRRIRIHRASDGVEVPVPDAEGGVLGFLGPDRLAVRTPAGPVVMRFDARETTTDLQPASVQPWSIPARVRDLQPIRATPRWVAYARQGRSGGEVAILDLSRDRLFDVPGAAPGRISGVSLDVDLEANALVVAWKGGVRRHDLGLPREPFVLRRVSQGIRAMEALADGRRLLVADWTGWFDRTPGSLVLLDAETGEPLRRFLEPGQRVIDVATHPTEPIVYAWGNIGLEPDGTSETIVAWDADTGERIWSQATSTGFTDGLAVTDDGRVVHEGSRVFDARTGAELDALPTGPGPRSRRDVVPLGGNRVFLLDRADEDHLVVDLTSGAVERRFPLSIPRSKDARVAVHPERRLVAIAANDRPIVYVVDLDTGTIVARPGPQGERVFSVAFHPDGTRLVTGSLDGRIRLFRIDPETPPGTQSFDLIGSIAAHDGLVRELVWMDGGDTLVSAGSDGTVRRWGLETRSERIAQLRRRIAETEVLDAWLARVVADEDLTSARELLDRIEAHAGFDGEQRTRARMRAGLHVEPRASSAVPLGE